MYKYVNSPQFKRKCERDVKYTVRIVQVSAEKFPVFLKRTAISLKEFVDKIIREIE